MEIAAELYIHLFACLCKLIAALNAGAVAVNLSAFDIDAVCAVIFQLGGMQTAVCVASCHASGIFRQQGTRLEKQH